MRTHHRPREAGVALVAVMLILAMLMALAAAMTTSINMDTALRGAYDRVTGGFYAAESGLNRAMGDYRNIFLNFNVPTGSDFAPHTITVGSRTVNYQITDTPGNPTSITIPAGQLFGGLNSQEYDYVVKSIALENNETEARVNAEFKVGYIPLFQFVAFYKPDLEIAPGPSMTLVGRVHSNGNLYLESDGNTLTIQDSIATNTTVQVSAQGNVYRGRKRANICDAGTVIVDKLQDIVAPFGGDLDPLGLNCTGAPSMPASSAGGGSARLVPASELVNWKGDFINQVESISIPDPDIGSRGSGIYWTRADLRIVLVLGQPIVLPAVGGLPAITLPHTIEVEDVAGNLDAAKTALLLLFMRNAGTAIVSSTPQTRPLFYTDVPITTGNPNNCNCTNGSPAGCTNVNAACYTPGFSGATTLLVPTAAQNNRVYGTGANMVALDQDYRRGGYYNWRERKWMYLLNLNVGDLLAWNMAQAAGGRLFDPADRTDGGVVIFLSVQGPNSLVAANNYGVRLFGSTTLPFPNMGADPTGVTVASDQAAYVLGNYNSAATLAAGKQPAAVIADSVNVLSNGYWQVAPAAGTVTNDAQSSNAALAGRNATNTTYNTAFIGGVDDTIPGGGAAGYNGGLENYPRFHENWGGGTTITYLGSFVCLGTPTHVNGAWCGTGGGCNIYNPPTRSYNYDTDFNNAANLPPLTPRFVYVQQVLFTEDFK